MTTLCPRAKPNPLSRKSGSHPPASLVQTQKRSLERLTRLNSRCHNQWRPPCVASQFCPNEQSLSTPRTAPIKKPRMGTTKTERATSKVKVSWPRPRLRAKEEFCSRQNEKVRTHPNNNKSLISHALRTILIVKCITP